MRRALLFVLSSVCLAVSADRAARVIASPAASIRIAAPMPLAASRVRGLVAKSVGTVAPREAHAIEIEQVGDVDEPVVWANVVGASLSGNTVTKTATTIAWDAGAASTNLIRDGYGYVEFTKTETAGRIMAGLSHGDSGVGYEDVDYGIHTDALGNVHVFEAGVYRGQVGTYVAGARFRVEVRYGVVRYLRNGQLLYTSAVPPTYPLRVDAELYDPGVAVTDVRVGSSTWTHEVGVTIAGSSLQKAGAAGWTSGAISANTLEAGDGALEFTATETDTSRAAGLSDTDATQSWQDIAYGIVLHDDATVEVVESGTSRGAFGSYATGDRFRVQVVSGVVTYACNDSVFYTSAVAPSYPLVVDTALDSAGATLTDVVLIPLVWTDLAGVSPSENSVTKTAADGWNAGASTTFNLLSDDGYLEFKAVETDTRRTVGFKSGTGTAETYADLAYAIDLGATGIVTLFEDGVSRGTFGSYAHGDRFRLEIAEGVLRYLRNGAVLYTSTAAPVYPLRGDVRLYTAGATVADLLGGTEAWLPPVNVTAMGSSFVKTGSVSAAYDAEALSSRGFGTGFIEFTASQNDIWRHVGLTNGNSGTDYTDLDFAIHINQVGQVHVFEGATYVGYFGGYVPGDRLRVEVANSIVRYLRNGSVFYTSGLTPTLPLRPDVNIYSPGASVLNVHSEGVPMADVPILSPGSGTYSSAQTVTMTTATPGAAIRYTVDGSAPTEASLLYTAPVAVTTSTTIKAAAFRSGWTPSPTASATYAMNFGTLAAPGISPAAGTYTSEAVVTLTSIAGATIRYTLDGNDPTTASTLYAAPFAVTTSSTLKAKAFHPDYSAGGVASAAYTIKVAAPVFSPGGGAYAAGDLITLTTATSGATIRYTLTGATPGPNDPAIASGGTLVAGNYILKAIASKNGCATSDVTTATYAITGAYTTLAAAGGGGHSLVLRADGTVWSFGDNGAGQLGDGTSTRRLHPIPVDGLTGVRAISAGGGHSLALLGDGTVRAWGANHRGQIGDGTGNHRLSPTAINLTGVTAVRTGTDHSLALLSDGTVRAWGSNGFGQLGDNSTVQRESPVAVSGLTDVIAIATGTNHSLAVRSDGTVWAWGSNARGELGDGTTTTRWVPAEVPGLTNVVAVGAGFYVSVALRADGTVWAWGNNDSGTVGDASQQDRWSPVMMTGVANVQAIAVGWSHVLLLKTDGTLMGVGANVEGQLGLPVGFTRQALAVPGLSGIAAIASGIAHSLVIASDGRVWAMGRNDGGQLGDGTTILRWAPAQIAGPDMVWRPWIPTIGTATGLYSIEQHPVITDLDPSATIRYTTTGIDPVETDSQVASGATVDVTQSLTLKARAFKNGAPPSEPAAATYELKVVPPAFSPPGGVYASPQAVSLSSTTSAAIVRYTLDGRIPTSYSPAFIAPLNPGTSTVKAFAQRSGWTSSDVATATYWMPPASTLASPTISPGTGTYSGERVVTISAAESGATVRYSVDGSDPTDQSPAYVRAFAVAQTTTVKARSFKAGFNRSAVAAATLTIATPGQGGAPSVSPPGGRFTTQRVVTITGPAGATLRYTTNGADPSVSDTTIASGGTLTIDRSMVLKVRAWQNGVAPSVVRRDDYVITGVIAAGEAFSMALKADGTVWTWGDNFWAELGDGASANRTAPVQVLSDGVAIAAGFHHALVVKADGTVWAWGHNLGGEVGDGTTTMRRSAVQVPGLTDVIAVAASFYNSYALKTDGTVWAWGSNSAGQIGDGTTTTRLSPVQIPGLSDVRAIAAGESFVLAIVSHGAPAGALWAWGANNVGQLGNGTTGTSLSPQLVVGASLVKSVVAGRAWAMARTADDEVLLWGSNDNGQQGNGRRTEWFSNADNLLPVRTGPWMGATAEIGAGHFHALSLGRDGRLWGWGRSCEFQLAHGATCEYLLSVEPIAAFTVAAQVSGGASHTLALAHDGQVWAWGHNGHGQLADGTLTWRSTPTAVPGFTLADNAFLAGDQDNDGLSTWREYQLGTDPLLDDTDGDGIPDAAEAGSGDAATNLDPDGDGLSNALEVALGTDPYNADTDGDTVVDGLDAFPLDPSRSQAPAPDPNDHTPPVITLIYPTNARPVGGGGGL